MGWDSEATGASSIAIGETAKSTGTNSIAIGTGAKATGESTVGTNIPTNLPVAIGHGAQAVGKWGMLLSVVPQRVLFYGTCNPWIWRCC